MAADMTEKEEWALIITVVVGVLTFPIWGPIHWAYEKVADKLR